MKIKWLSILLLVSFLVVGGTNTYVSAANSLIEKVKSASGGNGVTELEKRADESGAKIVKTIRNIGITVAVILFTWIGFTLWGAGGNPNALINAKGRVIFFFVGLFCAFGAEWIVGTALGFIDPDALK